MFLGQCRVALREVFPPSRTTAPCSVRGRAAEVEAVQELEIEASLESRAVEERARQTHLASVAVEPDGVGAKVDNEIHLSSRVGTPLVRKGRAIGTEAYSRRVDRFHIECLGAVNHDGNHAASRAREGRQGNGRRNLDREIDPPDEAALQDDEVAGVDATRRHTVAEHFVDDEIDAPVPIDVSGRRAVAQYVAPVAASGSVGATHLGDAESGFGGK